MKCPHCNNKLLQKAGGDINVRLKGKVTIDQDGICHAQCFWCGKPVEAPLELRKGFKLEDERFYVRRPS